MSVWDTTALRLIVLQSFHQTQDTCLKLFRPRTHGPGVRLKLTHLKKVALTVLWLYSLMLKTRLETSLKNANLGKCDTWIKGKEQKNVTQLNVSDMSTHLKIARKISYWKWAKSCSIGATNRAKHSFCNAAYSGNASDQKDTYYVLLWNAVK